MKKRLRAGWKNWSFLGKRELKAYEELDGWQLSMSSGQVVRKGMSYIFLEGFMGIWTFLSIAGWLRTHCMHSLSPWSCLTSHFSASLSTIWDVFVLTAFLGRVSPWLSAFLILPFLFSSSPMVKPYGFCFRLFGKNLKSILYTQAAVRSPQNEVPRSLSCSESFSSLL